MAFSRRFARGLLPFLLLVFFVFTLFAVSTGLSAVKAEESSKTFRIGHITDTHIFAESMCNMDSPAFQSALKTTTKLLVESEAAILTTLNSIYEMENPPMCLLVTGDLTSNGEVVGHKRLAEIFSEFTAKMRGRSGYEYFQILVTPGNHDNYNNSAISYMPTEEELLACGTAEERIALIDSYKEGKIVPSATYEDFFEIYGAFGYDINKMNNSSVSVEYFFDSDQWYDNDGITKKTPPQGVIDAYEASAHDLSHFAPYSRHGALSYIARFDDVTVVVFDGNAHEYIGDEADPSANTAGWEETTGGYIHERQLVWALNSTRQDVADGKLVIAMGHENFLPHFEYEDQVLSLFTYDNWVDASTALAGAGIHYGFSGHMHASDIAIQMTQNGDVFYDFETGAPISFGCPYRYVDFVTAEKADGTFTQDLYSTVVTVDKPVTYNAYQMTEQGDVVIKDGKIQKSSYITSIDGNTVGLDVYLKGSVQNLVSNIVSGYVNEGLYAKIAGIGEGGAFGGLMQALGSQLGNLDLHKPTFAEDGSVTMTTEPVEGYDIIALATDLVDFVFDFDLCFGRASKPYTIGDAVLEIYGGHLSGANPTSPSEAVAAFIEVCDDGTFVQYLIDMLTEVLFPQLETILNTPIKFSAKQPAGVDYVIDISNELKGNSTISMVLNMFDFHDVECIYDLLDKVEDILNNPQIDVVALVKSFLSNSVDEGLINTVLEYVNLYFEDYTSITQMVQEELIDKYVTDAFAKNLGNYAGNLVESLAVDPTPNGAHWNNNEGYNVTNIQNFHVVHSDVFGGHSYSGSMTAEGCVFDKKEGYATVENGRLPSMINFTFGENILSDRNFSWYTSVAKDPFDPDAVPESFIRYWKKGDKANAITIKATSVNTEFNIPNIDLGITFFNMTESARRYNRHTLSLTGLESGCYEYVLGSDDLGWTEVFGFTIAESGEEFSFSAISDIQGSVEDNYILSMNNFNAVAKYGFGDFILSGGDNVDNGKNIFQWEWLLNHQSKVWANNALVSTSGNHEDDGMIKDILAIPQGSTLTDSGYYYSYDYKGVHFIVLDTNDLSAENVLSEAQTAWLEDDLTKSEENSQINWTIVLLHKGPYTAGSHAFDADVEALREQLAPLFAEKGVDLVLQGHDHTYSVSEFIGADGNPVEVERDLRGAVINPQGVLYINMGTMGDKFYNYLYSGAVSIEKREEVAKELTKYLTEDGYLELIETPVFVKIDVTAKELNVNTYAIIGDKTVMVDNIIISDHKELPSSILIAIILPCVAVALIGIALGVVFAIKKKKKATAVSEGDSADGE